MNNNKLKDILHLESFDEYTNYCMSFMSYRDSTNTHHLK